LRLAQLAVGSLEEGLQDIAECLRGTTGLMRDSVTNATRQHQEFLPEAATTNRDIALKCLTTNQRNRICVYHHHVKANKSKEESGKKFKVSGVPYPRTITKTEKAKKNALPDEWTVDVLKKLPYGTFTSGRR
jgi:hypothetical protein